MENDSAKWIKLHSFADLQTAYIIKGALDAEGIPAMIPSDTMSSVYPTTLSWSAIEMYVPEQFIREANAILVANGIQP